MRESPRLVGSRGPVRSGETGGQSFRAPLNEPTVYSLLRDGESCALDLRSCQADNPCARVASVGDIAMSEYRRGILKRVRQKWWHFHELCEEYPTRSFSIRTIRPPEDELCTRCDALKHGRG